MAPEAIPVPRLGRGGEGGSPGLRPPIEAQTPPERTENHDFSNHFLPFYQNLPAALSRRREGLPPPTPPATNSDLLARRRARAPPI